MKINTVMQLGRIPNLPTVWTNTLAGMALVGGMGTGALSNSALSNDVLKVSVQNDGVQIALTLAALSLFYLAGMFLNDAFDAEWDRAHRQDRPIVRGEVSVTEVAGYACGFLALALVLLWFAANDGQQWLAVVSASTLLAAILLYNARHKQWPHAAWIMGICRLLVYMTAASVIATPNTAVLVAGTALLVYIAGITYLARSEHVNSLESRWPIVLLLCPSGFILFLLCVGYFDFLAAAAALLTLLWIAHGIRYLMPGARRNIPQAVGILLSGMCLIDTSLLLVLGQTQIALFTACCFAAGIVLQKWYAAS
ncbi:UbiA family prenyltransferase [Teredinibacter turnerae]|uniref:UbiA family prenyltransferase n=1 Tax=Teredinibacter turnerae TaxID=2426 RepID=UPI0003FDA31F|nr:UbiA family prenyltransferase [Teredinibacter turnerae]